MKTNNYSRGDKVHWQSDPRKAISRPNMETESTLAVTGSDWYTQSKTFGSNQFTVNSVSRHLEEANKSALFGEISTT